MRLFKKQSSDAQVDPMGQAVYDAHFHHIKHPLLVIDEFGPPVPMDVKYYFRDFEDMPITEQEALRQCHGRILDIGAGAGSHSLYLQEHSLDVTALDISANNCEVMKDRGIKNVVHQSIWDYDVKEYDTLLLMMNGLGFVGTINQLIQLLTHFHQTTKDNVQILVDGSDVFYLYENRPRPEDHYYGEVKCQYRYGTQLSPWFKWLFIDEGYMNAIARHTGWKFEVLERDTDRQYLARLTKR